MQPRSLAAALVIALAALLTIFPSLALATTYTDTVSGIELFATPSLGVFAGTATGSLPGTWLATVQHTPLSPNATITGGKFTLSTVLGASTARVTGSFGSGNVTFLAQDPGCGKQSYAVNGGLINVGVGGGTGTGSFLATLVHYRKILFGTCIPYFATVTGTVTLDF